MAKDIKRHITHLKSKVVESNAPKLIEASDLYEGEIAVNYAKGYETLSIKNESGDVVTFLPRPYNSARGGETIHPIFDGTGTAGGTNLAAAWSGNCEDIKTLYDGLTILYKINSAGYSSGDTLSINGGEPHKVLLNASTQLTTHYPVGSIIKLTYDSTQSASFYTGSTTQMTTTGVWKIENYDSDKNTDTIGYTVGFNQAVYKTDAAAYRYMLLLTKDETTLTPVNTKSNTTAGTKTLTTSEFDPFGVIIYKSSTTGISAGAVIPSGTTWTQYPLNLSYSFNTTNTLIANQAVYIVATPQSNGKVKLYSSPISQALPTSDDGLVYIYLGHAYNETSIFLTTNHPVYQYKNGQLRQYVGSFGTMAFADTSSYSSATEVNTALSGKSDTGHTHDDRYYTEAELTGSSTTVVVAKASSATTAASAAKLANTSAVGSGTQPVFFTADGVPSTTTYSLEKSVPSDAVFTDTATTLSGHYTITATTADTKSANASSTSELAWGSAVVTGVTISGDAKGHITAVSVASGKLKTPVTGVTLASGTNNGTVKLTVNGSATDNIAVKGLGTAAYKDEGYFAGSGHTHDTSIATSTGTNQLTLGFGSKYSLNAGGTSYIFTMPSSASSWNSVTSVTTSSTAGNISVNGSNVAVAGLGGAAYLNTGTTAGTVAAGDHTHSAYVNQNAFSNVKLGSSTIAADSATDTLEVVSGNSFIGLTADTTNDKLTIGVNTGTTDATVARGDHSHSNYAVTGRTISTASGLTGGGDLSADRTIGLETVSVVGYTGSGITTNTVSYDNYGRISSAASIVYSASTISSNQTNVVCPSSITGVSNSGAQAIVIYKNDGSTTDYTVSVSTTNQISPTGEQLNLKCPKNGYCEINYLNIGGVIYVRGV